MKKIFAINKAFDLCWKIHRGSSETEVPLHYREVFETILLIETYLQERRSLQNVRKRICLIHTAGTLLLCIQNWRIHFMDPLLGNGHFIMLSG